MFRCLYTGLIFTVTEGQSGSQAKTATRQITVSITVTPKGQTPDPKREENTLPLLIWMDLARNPLGFGSQVIPQKLSEVEQTG